MSPFLISRAISYLQNTLYVTGSRTSTRTQADRYVCIYIYIYCTTECETAGVRVEVSVKGPPLCRKGKDFERVI